MSQPAAQSYTLSTPSPLPEMHRHTPPPGRGRNLSWTGRGNDGLHMTYSMLSITPEWRSNSLSANFQQRQSDRCPTLFKRERKIGQRRRCRKDRTHGIHETTSRRQITQCQQKGNPAGERHAWVGQGLGSSLQEKIGQPHTVCTGPLWNPVPVRPRGLLSKAVPLFLACMLLKLQVFDCKRS